MDTKLKQRLKRKRRIRKKIFGTPERPRFSVYRSERHVYAQLIDDLSGRTLAAAHSLEQRGKNASNKSAAEKVGALIAEKAKVQNIKGVTFDRNGFLFHGVVKSLAEAARKGGLEF